MPPAAAWPAGKELRGGSVQMVVHYAGMPIWTQAGARRCRDAALACLLLCWLWRFALRMCCARLDSARVPRTAWIVTTGAAVRRLGCGAPPCNPCLASLTMDADWALLRAPLPHRRWTTCVTRQTARSSRGPHRCGLSNKMLRTHALLLAGCRLLPARQPWQPIAISVAADAGPIACLRLA